MDGKVALCRLRTRKTLISQAVEEWDLTIPFPAARFDEQLSHVESLISSIGKKNEKKKEKKIGFQYSILKKKKMNFRLDDYELHQIV